MFRSALVRRVLLGAGGSSSNGAENNAKTSSMLDSPGMGPFSPLPLELILDIRVGEVEVDGRRLETVVAQDLRHRRQADPLLQGRRGKRVSQHMRTHVLGQPRAVGHRLDDVLGTRVLTGNAFSRAKWCSRRARTRFDIGTTRTLVFLPSGPPLPFIRNWRCCQRTLLEVRSQSSATWIRCRARSRRRAARWASRRRWQVGQPPRRSEALGRTGRALCPRTCASLVLETQPPRLPTPRLTWPYGVRKGLSFGKTRGNAPPRPLIGGGPECVKIGRKANSGTHRKGGAQLLSRLWRGNVRTEGSASNSSGDWRYEVQAVNLKPVNPAYDPKWPRLPRIGETSYAGRQKQELGRG